MAIEDSVCLAALLGGSAAIDQVVYTYEARRRPRVESIRAAVRMRAALGGMDGPVTSELLAQHRSDFSDSLAIYEELVEDPFAGEVAS